MLSLATSVILTCLSNTGKVALYTAFIDITFLQLPSFAMLFPLKASMSGPKMWKSDDAKWC